MNKTIKMQVKTSGEGAPLVLLPGGMMGWESWEPFTDYFTRQNRKVILVQLLNVEYGLENRMLPDNYSVKTESRAFRNSLDALNYDQPLDIVAWSYGALVALDFSLDHPGRIRTLTLIEPPAIWILKEAGQVDPETQKTIDFFMTLKGDITEEMVATFLKEVGLVKPGQSPHDLPGWQHGLAFRQSLRCSPATVSQRDDLKRLKSFNPLVFLIKGTGSAPYLHRVTDLLQANLSHARVIELPGGHAAHIVSRNQFLEELERFQEETRGSD